MTRKREIIEIPAKYDLHGTKPGRQLRVAAYCRVSTNLEAQKNSYQAQKDYYTDMIAANPEWTLVEIFADQGISGTSAQRRPDFQRMIHWCERGKIDLIITKSISRFARNTLDCLYYVRHLQELGVSILFETEGLDTSNMDNELILTIFGATSQAESEAISSRVKWGVQASFRAGKVRYQYKNWLGYKKGEDGEPEIIPEEAAIVRRIFSLYLDGLSIRDICDVLEDDQIPAKNGKIHWPITTIRNILSNEKYTGDALLQKTYTTDPISKKQKKNDGRFPMYRVKNCHDAIVSHEIYDLVQAERNRRATVKDAVKSKDSSIRSTTYSKKYALSSVLVCRECNTLFQRCTWSKHGKKRYVWRCRNRLANGPKYCKHSPTLDEADLHRALVKAINSQLYCPEYLLAPFDGSSMETPIELDARPAKSWLELYANLLEMQRQLDLKFAVLVQRCTENQEWESSMEQFRGLIRQRNEYETWINAFNMRQHQDSYQETRFELPYQLTEYNDLITRYVLNTVTVLDKEHLQIQFKSGLELEWTIE